MPATHGAGADWPSRGLIVLEVIEIRSGLRGLLVWAGGKFPRLRQVYAAYSAALAYSDIGGQEQTRWRSP